MGTELVKPIDHTEDEEAIRNILEEFVNKLWKSVMRVEFHNYLLTDEKMNEAGRTIRKFYGYDMQIDVSVFNHFKTLNF